MVRRSAGMSGGDRQFRLQHLAQMYRSGTGVTPDLAEAYYFALLSYNEWAASNKQAADAAAAAAAANPAANSDFLSLRSTLNDTEQADMLKSLEQLKNQLTPEQLQLVETRMVQDNKAQNDLKQP